MKRICILLTGIFMGLTSLAQTDSTTKTPDTIKIGSMVIIKTPGEEPGEREKTRIYRRTRKEYKPSAITTNWLIVDLGFANYTDNTDYAASLASGFTGPGIGKDQMELRTGKSSNVNIWLFMQRLNMIKNVVNLKYGLGIETNNYRFRSPVLFETDPTRVVLDNSTHYSKNKLAADYVTIPMMLNFNFTPNRRRGFGVSVGASAGYLYNSRQKTVTEATGKEKVHDDFDLRKWKISYVGELQLGPVTLYGSLAEKSIFEKGLDQTPYAVGIRLSSWH
jgi:outer membrane protein with beta-barrel domain